MAVLSELAASLNWRVHHSVDVTSRFSSFVFSRVDPTVLGTIPSTLLLGALPVVWHLSKSTETVARADSLLQLKIAVGCLLIGTEAGFLASRIINASTLTDGPVLTALLSLFATCSLRPLLALDHQRTLSSSAFLTIWLIIAAACDVLRAAAFYHDKSLNLLSTAAVIIPAVSSTVFKAGLLTLNELPKLDLITDIQLRDSMSKIQTSGPLTRFILLPFYEKFLSRFDSDLAITDLADLDKDVTARRLLRAFNKEWATADLRSPDVLAYVCGYILRFHIAFTAPLRLIRSLFTIAQPILVRRIVQYVLGVYLLNSGISTALALIGAAVFVYAGAAISGAFLAHAMTRMATVLRGTLIAAVYQKTLCLTVADAQQHTAMTVISKRVESTVREIALIHNLWATPLELAACIYILFRALGNAAFLVTLPALLSHCIGWYVREMVPADRVFWHDKIKDRVTEASGILSETKAVKSIGLDMAILSRLRKLYSIEIASFKNFRKWAIVLEASMQFSKLITYPLVLGGALMVSVWTKRLSAVDAFTALATIAVMSEPLNSCSTIWSEVKSAATRLHQIQDYLLLRHLHSQRLRPHIPYDLGEHSTGRVENAITPQDQTQTQDSAGQHTVFELVNAAISIEKLAYPVMERVNSELKNGDITMIVGRAGTGKTSLLRSLIGETRISAGYRYKAPNHSTAYCGQSTWLRNTTVRHNILGYCAMDVTWYNQVLDACLLRPDLRQLPKSDMSFVGTDGNKLTSSQRHRIALARALYARSSILVLDDIFSNLDSNTVSNIGARVFGPNGLLRQSRSTAVLVTHSRPLLRFASRIWLFDVDGRLVEQSGPIDARFRRKFRTILASIASDEKERRGNNGSEDIAPEIGNLQSSATEELVSYNQKADAKKRSNWRTLLFYIQSFEYPKLLTLLGLAILIPLCETFPVVYIYRLLRVQSDSETTFWISGYVLFAMFGAIFTGWSLCKWWIQLVPNSLDRIHDRMLETIMDTTLNAICSIDMRATLTLFAQDMFSLSSVLPTEFYLAFLDIWNVSIQCCILIYFGRFGSILVAPVIIATLAIIQFCYMSKSRQLTYLELETQGRFQSHLIDTENGLEHIRAFGWEVENLKSALRLINASQKPFYYNHGARNWLRFAVDTVKMCVGVLLTMQTVFHLQTTHISGPGVSLTILISLSASLPSLIFNWTSLQASLGALERIRTYTETTPRESGLPIKADQTVRRQWPEDGKVVMQNVSAKYKDSDNSPVVLKNVSLMLPPGRHIGVVGGFGSGKTTFTRAILNFLDYSGDIIIDGVNIAKVPQSILRSRITTVSQDGIKFDESIRYNLCPWTMSISETEGNVHDDSIILMLKTLKLWHLVVMNGGLDSPYKTLGLSPGQKKLMCIARACLHKLSTRSRLVIMDGPLDGLDDEDRELALVAMDAAFFDCTIIEVAESAEDVSEAHLILHMENGRIVRKELPNEGVPESKTPPPPPPNMPTAPVPMNPLFQGMLDKSLAAENEVKQQLKDQGLWPPGLGD